MYQRVTGVCLEATSVYRQSVRYSDITGMCLQFIEELNIKFFWVCISKWALNKLGKFSYLAHASCVMTFTFHSQLTCSGIGFSRSDEGLAGNVYCANEFHLHHQQYCIGRMSNDVERLADRWSVEMTAIASHYPGLKMNIWSGKVNELTQYLQERFDAMSWCPKLLFLGGGGDQWAEFCWILNKPTSSSLCRISCWITQACGSCFPQTGAAAGKLTLTRTGVCFS